MKQINLIGLFLGLIGLSHGTSIPSKTVLPLQLQPASEDNALELNLYDDENKIKLHATLGLSLPNAVGNYNWTSCSEPPNFPLRDCYSWGDFAQVIVKESSINDTFCARIEWTSSYARELEDCFDLLPGASWYGGDETGGVQRWPMNQEPRGETAYVTGFIREPYWLLSNGVAIVMDPDTPLFYSLNSTRSNRFCFIARDQTPYTKRSPLKMSYEICTGDDVKSTHQRVMSNFFKKPSDLPDEQMLIKPFWSTWAEYHADINQSMVLEYTNRVISEGFQESSHIQIDDNWETCYGDEVFDPVKFPDPKQMVDEVKAKGLRITLWVHPFVNFGCELFKEGVEKGYFVKNAKGKAGITDWWQGTETGYIDVTNPEAVEWWAERLRSIQERFGFDSFKVDSGETHLLPASPSLPNEDPNKWPNIFSHRFVEVIGAFGGMIEARVAHMNQDVPIFIRMQDKDSRWGYDNGLKSLIPTLLQMSIVGYSFVLPDMIGGNAYQGRPDKELYVRWMQANIFMPSVQFSLVPWSYDEETVRITKKVLEHRLEYQEEILNAARQSVVDGSPMNRPIWWVDPTDEVTFTIDDEYMLGDNILVAPVVEQGMNSRDIYLPVGMWRSGVDSGVYMGPTWLRNYPAPLDVTPFFVKIT